MFVFLNLYLPGNKKKEKKTTTKLQGSCNLRLLQAAGRKTQGGFQLHVSKSANAPLTAPRG